MATQERGHATRRGATESGRPCGHTRCDRWTPGTLRRVAVRKRMKRREEPGGNRSITFSCERRAALMAEPSIRAIFAQSLAALHRQRHFELFAWVAMPEHAHLLVRPATGLSVDRILVSLKLAIAKRALARWREDEAAFLREVQRPDGTLRFWQKGGGFDRNVRDMAEFTKVVRYIHRNPVGRGLVEHLREWEASSVHWWMGLRDGEVECDAPPGDPRSWAEWRGFV